MEEGEHNWEQSDADHTLNDTIAAEKEIGKEHETQMEETPVAAEWD